MSTNPEALLTTYLASILTVNAISVPIIGYLTTKYQENKGHSNTVGKKISRVYKIIGWVMIIALFIGAIGSVLLTLYLSGWWQIAVSDILIYITIVFIAIAILIPAIMLYLGVKELN